MSRPVYALIAAGFMGAGAAIIPAATGAAAGPPAAATLQAIVPPDSGLWITIAKWDRLRHGERCRLPSDRCRHFHRGYYYERNWWILPLIVDGRIVSDRYEGDHGDHSAYGNRHLQWCRDRYRSYKPRTNTWLSYGGRVRQCISPYS
jgi:hypothetical protein